MNFLITTSSYDIHPHHHYHPNKNIVLPGIEVPQPVEKPHLRRQIGHIAVPRDVQHGEVGQLVDEGGDHLDAVVAHVQHAQAVEHQPRLRA